MEDAIKLEITDLDDYERHFFIQSVTTLVNRANDFVKYTPAKNRQRIVEGVKKFVLYSIGYVRLDSDYLPACANMLHDMSQVTLNVALIVISESHLTKNLEYYTAIEVQASEHYNIFSKETKTKVIN